MSFKFACPHCGQRIEAESDQAGTDAACPACEAAFTVPDAAGEKELPTTEGEFTPPEVPSEAPELGPRGKTISFAVSVCILIAGLAIVPNIWKMDIVSADLLTPAKYEKSYPNPAFRGFPDSKCPVTGCNRHQFHLDPGVYSIGVRARKCEVHADRDQFGFWGNVWLNICPFFSLVRYVACLFLGGAFGFAAYAGLDQAAKGSSGAIMFFIIAGWWWFFLR